MTVTGFFRILAAILVLALAGHLIWALLAVIGALIIAALSVAGAIAAAVFAVAFAVLRLILTPLVLLAGAVFLVWFVFFRDPPPSRDVSPR